MLPTARARQTLQDSDSVGGKSTAAISRMEKPRNMEAVDEELFEFITGALTFALNYRHGTMKRPSITQLMKSERAGRGLGGLDGAAQAAMIKSQMDWLPEHRRNILAAKFTAATTPCECRSECCRGWRENPDWSAALNEVTKYAFAQGLAGPVAVPRVFRSLIARHFGVRENFITLAAAAGLNRHTVGEQYKAIHEHLKTEGRYALWDAEGVLKEAGVVR